MDNHIHPASKVLLLVAVSGGRTWSRVLLPEVNSQNSSFSCPVNVSVMPVCIEKTFHFVEQKATIFYLLVKKDKESALLLKIAHIKKKEELVFFLTLHSFLLYGCQYFVHNNGWTISNRMV